MLTIRNLVKGYMGVPGSSLATNCLVGLKLLSDKKFFKIAIHISKTGRRGESQGTYLTL